MRGPVEAAGGTGRDPRAGSQPVFSVFVLPATLLMARWPVLSRRTEPGLSARR